MAGDGGGDFAGTICSICYEDLNPITEDLQSISICGHVFHELCLQQWFEYCLKAKKHTCPVCKQSCKASNACRLYFQSVGDVDGTVIHRKPLDSEEDAGILRKEVKRLEVKVSGLGSELDRKGNALEQLTKELGACKEQAKVDVVLKNEALKQKASVQSQLRVKSEELEKTTFECFRLKERNMALAKEIATLKLVSDLELNEDDAVRLATLGNGSNHKDTVDTLARSLVVRNREYRELISKCNLLGRVEDRYSKKLEKAKEKIVKLKARVQELETAAEVREDQYLMSLKASKRKKCLNIIENSINSNANVLKACKIALNEQKKQTSKLNSEMDPSVHNSEALQFFSTENCIATEDKGVNLSDGSKYAQSLDRERSFISIDDDTSEFIKTLPECSSNDCKEQVMDAAPPSKPTAVKSHDAAMQEKSSFVESSRIDVDIEMANISADSLDEDVTILCSSTKHVQPIVNIRKESPLTIANPGDICFSGGLLGPDGSHRYLGKWCKRGLNSESTSAKGSGNGDLIAVGADGRGGKIKVLRNQNQTFSDGKEKSLSSKRLKTTPKTSNLRPQGCLQIEHFFGRVTQ